MDLVSRAALEGIVRDGANRVTRVDMGVGSQGLLTELGYGAGGGGR